ncbi:hypothetical protein M408DRAFT_331516 [Serendipita vermifera MAFF 305830]|uniref:GPI-anchored wall transfer protein 1 n=1 Tax=Serendipita vermifera MAFF 305830 TaxID=933852 RepID=A0A0C2WEG0_SERVB|nr:hypothetical protein M408DRAFT_331516 [Serendipita vermifera MAFF 305830]
MSSSSYKSAKELFVSDTKGSTITHINLISLIAFTSLCLYSSLRTHLPFFPPKNPFLLFAVQFVVLVLPLLGAVTYAAQGQSGFEALKWNVVLGMPALAVCLRFDSKRRIVSESIPTSSPNPSMVDISTEHSFKKQQQRQITVLQLPAVTTWRAHMMIMTVLGILAVDFPVFPRSLAKCEVFGVSLMDLGVGSFIFAQGVASALPLIKEPDHLSKRIGPKVLASLKKTSPLLLLGLVRLVLVKSTDYPGEHISEYGTHWNFFITLAAIPPLQMSLQPLFGYLPVPLVGLLVTFVHQLFLSFTKLQYWTLHSPRTNIINHNKEGLVSLPGYLAIHLLGLSVGLLIFPPTPSHFQRTRSSKVNNSDSSSEDEADIKDDVIEDLKNGSIETRRLESLSGERDDSKTAIELCSYGVLYAVLFLFVRLAAPKDDVSRVLANLQYVLWITTFNIFFLLLYIVHDIYFYPSLTRKPRATDAAAQLGPTAPPTSTNDAWAASTSTSITRPSLSHEPSRDEYGYGQMQAHARGGHGNSRPGSRQGFLTVEDSENDMAGESGPSKRRRSARKSWEGTESHFKGLKVGEASRSSKREVTVSQEEESLRKSSPELLEGFNRNGLVIFLLANVLTGIINLSIETIYMPDGTALGILGAYLLFLCGFAWTFRGTRLLKL